MHLIQGKYLLHLTVYSTLNIIGEGAKKVQIALGGGGGGEEERKGGRGR